RGPDLDRQRDRRGPARELPDLDPRLAGGAERVSAAPDAVAEARDLLAELVDIPSPSGSEGRIVDRIESLCAEWSLPATRVRSELGRDSLIVGAAERPALAFVAHVDTIAPPWPARAVIDGDVVRGLGSADDKGGVVACLIAARDLVAAGEDLD